ncbi:MAG TPA: 3-phosphoshikimate 1-carboxyvinyltransferase [Gaiellaceae bacterium]
MLIEPGARITGHVAVPGDKSISHRSLLIGALSAGPTRVRGFGRGGDTESTIGAVRALGGFVDDADDREIVVHGADFRDAEIDCGNAGTLIRLIAGLLAGRNGAYVLTGDESLSSRPMERIAEPLRRMGAQIDTEDGHAPLRIAPAQLRGIDYELPVASAQVKSALLLAGLGAESATTVVEPTPTRDHTELMLEAAGIRVRRRPTSVTVEPGTPRLNDVVVPGDISSAAPLLVAAALLPGSDLTIHDVGLNPRRTGLLGVLERMGARIAIFERRREGREPAGAVQVQFDELVATEVAAGEVPAMVDELPLVALLAAHARGQTRIRGAQELRVKETDRIDAVTDALRSIGARVRGHDDGWTITGVPARLRGGRIDARGDHSIAMLGAIAGLASRDGVQIEGAEIAAISFPGFYELLNTVVQR